MLQHTVQYKWRVILNRTSYTVLKLLKRYHQDAITTLTNEINNFEARLCENPDFAENLAEIQENIQRLTTTYDQRKTKKVSKLIKINQEGQYVTIIRKDHRKPTLNKRTLT